MTYDRSELSHALADVRRAYRLLWAYQRRMNDLATAFSHHLGFRSYYQEQEKTGGWSKLPMISFGYLSVRTVHPDSKYQNDKWWDYPRAGDMLLYLWLESDSGFTQSRKNSGKGEPNPLDFPSVDEAQTSLHADILLNEINRTEITNWAEIASKYVHRGTLLGGIKRCGLRFDVTDLGDEESVLASAEKLKSQAIGSFGIPWAVVAEDINSDIQSSPADTNTSLP